MSNLVYKLDYRALVRGRDL